MSSKYCYILKCDLYASKPTFQWCILINITQTSQYFSFFEIARYTVKIWKHIIEGERNLTLKQSSYIMYYSMSGAQGSVMSVVMFLPQRIIWTIFFFFLTSFPPGCCHILELDVNQLSIGTTAINPATRTQRPTFSTCYLSFHSHWFSVWKE